MQHEYAWNKLVNSPPGLWDVRLILPSSPKAGTWPLNKRLFIVDGGSDCDDQVTLIPLLGNGSVFEADLEYLQERTVILPNPEDIGGTLMASLKEVLAARDYEFLTQSGNNRGWTHRDRTYTSELYTSMNTKFHQNNPKETKKMNVTNKVKNANVDAVKVAAKITAGKTMNGLVADKLVPFLPENMRMLADTPIGAIVIANLVNTLATVYSESNRSDTSTKLVSVSNAMVTAATVDFVQAFDIDEIVREFLSSTEARSILEK